MNSTKQRINDISHRNQTKQNNTYENKTKFPNSLLIPFKTKVSIILGTTIKRTLARLISIVHLDGFTYYLLAHCVRNVVIDYLGNSPVDVILVNPVRVIFPLASAVNVTCVRKSHKVRMDVFLLALLCNENEIDAMFSHNVQATFQPLHGLLIIDEIFHLVKDEYTIMGNFLVVEITYHIANIVDNVIFDKGLMNPGKGRERRDAYASYIREKRTIVFYSRQNNLLHCKQSFSATGVPVVNQQLTWHSLPTWV